MKKIFYGLVVCIMAVVTVLPNVSAATYESKNWDALVKLMKSEELVTQIKEQLSENTSITITSDEHNLNFAVKNQAEGIDYQVKYSQYNK